MREITSHKVNGLNDAIDIHVLDESGTGSACNIYSLRVNLDRDSSLHETTELKFQNGPIKEVGFNGISNESLLAIVEDRLKCFQAGEFSCRENALALTHLQEAMHWLHHRTRERMQRNVEGTYSK